MLYYTLVPVCAGQVKFAACSEAAVEETMEKSPLVVVGRLDDPRQVIEEKDVAQSDLFDRYFAIPARKRLVAIGGTIGALVALIVCGI